MWPTVNWLMPVLNWANVCSPNILWTLWQTMIRFLIELLVHRIWFGQSKLYFILNWLVFCNEMQASARTCGRQHDRKCRLKSSQYTFIIPHSHRVIQLTTISFWASETRLRLPQVNKFPPKRVKNLVTLSSIFIFIFSSSTGELCSQPIRGNDHQIGRMFPEHVKQSFLDPEYSFAEYFQLGSRRNIRPIKNRF